MRLVHGETSSCLAEGSGQVGIREASLRLRQAFRNVRACPRSPHSAHTTTQTERCTWNRLARYGREASDTIRHTGRRGLATD